MRGKEVGAGSGDDNGLSGPVGDPGEPLHDDLDVLPGENAEAGDQRVDAWIVGDQIEATIEERGVRHDRSGHIHGIRDRAEGRNDGRQGPRRLLGQPGQLEPRARTGLVWILLRRSSACGRGGGRRGLCG
jgi:hypothetical protein